LKIILNKKASTFKQELIDNEMNEQQKKNFQKFLVTNRVPENNQRNSSINLNFFNSSQNKFSETSIDIFNNSHSKILEKHKIMSERENMRNENALQKKIEILIENKKKQGI